MTPDFRVLIHSGRCASSGGCRVAAPTVFGADENGWVILLDEHPVDKLDEVLSAHDACPLGVIEVLNSNGESLA